MQVVKIERECGPQSRMRISIDDKLKIIDMLESKQMSRLQVADQFSMSKSTISKIMKDKKKYRKPEFMGKIRMRKLKYYELEEPLFRYANILIREIYHNKTFF